MLLQNKGIVTFPFLLVSGIIIFFFLAFFALAMTLVHVSITQYMSYSVARKLSLGGLSVDDQKQNAEIYYTKLRESFFKPAAYEDAGDWFVIPTGITTDNRNMGFIDNFNNEIFTTDRRLFYGVGFEVAFNMMDKFKIPLLGAAASAPYEYKAFAQSFLGREPSQDECFQFNKERRDKIEDEYSLSSLDVKAAGDPGKEGDNGC